MLSYHDVEVEFEGQPRIAIFNAPFNWELTCTRTAGWQLWKWENAPFTGKAIRSMVIADEYGGDEYPRLSIWVGGVQVLDRNHVRADR